MLPSDRFVAGLAAFLVGHLLFIAAFRSTGARLRWPPAPPLAIVAGVSLSVLWPHLGGLEAPAVVYTLALSGMAWWAWSAWLERRAGGSLMAAAGATVFLLSDAALAANRFRAPFAGADLLVLGTYYLAIWMIAWSVGRIPTRRHRAAAS